MEEGLRPKDLGLRLDALKGLGLRQTGPLDLDIVAVTHIFNYLPVSALMVCACVCKKWKVWANYEHLWQWRLALLEQYTSSTMIPANLKRLKTLLKQPPFPSPIFSLLTPVTQMHEKFDDIVTKLWVSLLLGVANHYTLGVTACYGPSVMIEARETGTLRPKQYYFDPIGGEVGILKYNTTGILTRKKLMHGDWQLLYDKVKERLAPLHI